MEGLFKLGLNGATFLAQLITFGVLFILLRMFAFKPILKMLDDRSHKVKESIEQIETVREEAAQAQADNEKQIVAARKEGQEVTAQALRAGEELRQKAQEDAKKDAETIIEKAQAEIQREREEAIDELRKEFADLTILAAGKVIDQALDEKADRQLINKTLEESSSLQKD